MKHFHILLCVFASIFAACSSSNDNTPATDGSTLIVPSAPVVLSKTDSVKTVDLKLSCGCGFTLQVTSIDGDTNVIKFSPIEKMGDILSQHSITFSYSPSVSSSSQPVTLNILARKHTYSYTNKVSVQVN